MSDGTIKLQVVDLLRMEFTPDPNDGIALFGRSSDGRNIEMCLTAGVLLQLEGFITQVNLERAKYQALH